MKTELPLCFCVFISFIKLNKMSGWKHNVLEKSVMLGNMTKILVI